MSYAETVRNSYDQVGVEVLLQEEDNTKRDLIFQYLLGEARRRGVRIVLDLGCGKGDLISKFSLEGFITIGIDISEACINYSSRALSSYILPPILINGSMSEIPLRANSVDMIISTWDSFSHLIDEEDQVRCIKDVYRIAKLGSYVFFEMIDPLKYEVSPFLNKNGVINYPLRGHQFPVFLHRPSTLRNIAQKGRFDNPRIEYKKFGDSRKLILELEK